MEKYVQILSICVLCLEVKSSQVLLVSMDGFRWDYLNKVQTPNFDRLAQRGTKAQFINNTFITKTFPCHYSIATGLYEESHGIIGNTMYDPVFNATFSMRTTESRWWDGGEPIWVTARRHNLTSATYFWPGSESEVRGYRPNIWLPYNESVPFNDRIDTTIQWITVNKTDFVSLYFNEPDSTGHQYGPDSDQVKEKVRDMDKVLGYLLDKFDASNLWDNVNLIVTSDHGMTTIDTVNRVVDITDHVDMSNLIFTVDDGPIMHIYPAAEKIDQVVQSLQNVSHITVYKKENIPLYWHYGNNRRVMPVFLVADEGWYITKNKTMIARYDGKGTHGYNNQLLSMKPIFLARGPNFKENYIAQTFKSIDIYPMICKLLGIQPSPNNGSLIATSSFLVDVKPDTSTTNVGLQRNQSERHDVSCNSDSMSVFIPSTLLSQNETLSWRDPHCTVTNNGTHYVSVVSLTACGTTVKFTDSEVIFENDLIIRQSTSLPVSSHNDIVDFGGAYSEIIPVKCVYPRRQNVTTAYIPAQTRVRFFEKRYGHMDVELEQYHSDKFDTVIRDITYPREVPINQDMYIKLHTIHNSSDIAIKVDSCVATPSIMPADGQLYPLIDHGCPASPAVKLYPSAFNEVKFSVHAFEFKSSPGSVVYIHCQISVCLAKNPQCVVGCRSRQRREVSAADDSSHLVSGGPYLLVAEQGSVQMATIVAAVCACLAVVATIVAAVGWRRKLNAPKHDSKLISD